MIILFIWQKIYNRGMREREKFYTVKYALHGLYKNEEEIEKFLKNRYFSLDFIPFFSIWRVLFNLKKYKTLQVSRLINYIFHIRDSFCEFKGIKEKEESPLFLIRVDDFPHWEKTLDDFKKFHNIMEKYKTPYLLGVTPCLSSDRHNPFNTEFRRLSQDEAELIKHPLIEVAMHGFSHQTNNYKKNMEFVGIKKEEVIEKIEKGLGIFNEYGIRPIAFIPPFDEIDMTSYRILSRYFKIITGGPASAKYLGYKVSPSLFRGAIYVPSYRPLCNNCLEIYKFLNNMGIKRRVILSLVIHWASETKNNYKHLEELLEMLKGSVMKWSDLLILN